MNDNKLEAALGISHGTGSMFNSVGYDHDPERYHRVVETSLPLTFEDVQPGMHIFTWNTPNRVVTKEGVVIRGVEEEDDPNIGQTHTLLLKTENGIEKVYAFMMGLRPLWTTELSIYHTYVMPSC